MTIAGSSVTGMTIIGCLIASIAGIISNWMYAKGYNLTYPISKGAYWVFFLVSRASMSLLSIIILD